MLIVKSSERKCCTCEHWNGTRIKEDDGAVYSLARLEGICSVASETGSEMRAPSAPFGTCQTWKAWEDLGETLKIDCTEPFPSGACLYTFEWMSAGHVHPGQI